MILAAILVTNLGYGMIIPILPIYAKSFRVSYGAIGFLISSFAIARLITDLACRQLVERLGYLRSVTFGVIVVSISSLGNAVAPSFDLAVAARFAAGIGSAVLFTALYGYLLAIARPELLGRTMGLFWGTFGVGSIAGAPIGGVLSHSFGLRASRRFIAATSPSRPPTEPRTRIRQRGDQRWVTPSCQQHWWLTSRHSGRGVQPRSRCYRSTHIERSG